MTNRWGYDATRAPERLMLAVEEKIPFKYSIERPAIPSSPTGDASASIALSRVPPARCWKDVGKLG
jgi:hypothetical protein